MSDSKPLEIKSVASDGLARKMGRMCCGGRCLTVKEGGEIKDAMYIDQSNFKDYNCMVNWFFLYIQQDRDAIYHHQTCMAKLPGTPTPTLNREKFAHLNSNQNTTNMFNDKIGPITSITDADQYLEWLEKQFEGEKIPTIVCPNTHCGCGICVVKAKDKGDFNEIMSKYINMPEQAMEV